jgi:hypothetical protein
MRDRHLPAQAPEPISRKTALEFQKRSISGSWPATLSLCATLSGAVT